MLGMVGVTERAESMWSAKMGRGMVDERSHM